MKFHRLDLLFGFNHSFCRPVSPALPLRPLLRQGAQGLGDEILVRLQRQDVILSAEFITWVAKRGGLARGMVSSYTETSGCAHKTY